MCGGCRVSRSGAGGRPAGATGPDRSTGEAELDTYDGDGRRWDREMLVAAVALVCFLRSKFQSPQLSRPQLSAFNDANAATRRATLATPPLCPCRLSPSLIIQAGSSGPGHNQWVSTVPHWLRGIFFIFIFKKNKILKIYDGFEKFQNYTPVAPWLGDRT